MDKIIRAMEIIGKGNNNITYRSTNRTLGAARRSFEALEE